MRRLRAGSLGKARVLLAGSLVSVAGLVVSPWSAASAAADEFTVTVSDDDGSGSVAGTLSWAFAQANTDPGVSTIRFGSGVSRIEFSGSASQVPINTPVSVVGPGYKKLTVDFNSNCGLFVQYMLSDMTVSFSGVTFVGGLASKLTCSVRPNLKERGGAIYLEGQGDLSISPKNSQAVFTGVQFDSNSAVQSGGAVALEWGLIDLAVTNSRFVNNVASEEDGGAINQHSSGDALVSNSYFSGNKALDGDGGAISFNNTSDPGDLVWWPSSTVSGSSFYGNVADGRGGAIEFANGSGKLVNSTVANNYSDYKGGGVSADITLLVAQSTITGNTARDSEGGGGLEVATGYYTPTDNENYDEREDKVTFSIVQSTISGNHVIGNEPLQGKELLIYAKLGSGPVTSPAPSIIGSIVAGAAGPDESSIRISNYLAYSYPNLYQAWVPELQMSDSIMGPIAVNSDDGPQTVATLTDLGGNQFDVTDPGLEGLANNGGPTKTMALKDTSPARDAGPLTVPSYDGNSYDQRGSSYVRTYGLKTDVGAFEWQTQPELPPTGGGSNRGVLLAGVLLALGFGVVTVSRRRRPVTGSAG